MNNINDNKIINERNEEEYNKNMKINENEEIEIMNMMMKVIM